MMFAFRTDASRKIGIGHVMRCLTLAKALKRKGAKCKFICRDQKMNFIEKIKKEGFEVITLPKFKQVKKTERANDINDIGPVYSDWIGTSWIEDAKQTINALNKEKVDWLVIDHYGIDKKWQKKLRPYAKKIMIIDDLANRNHDCDLLLDQNLIANFKNRYKNLLPKYCNTLLGPQYALLQTEYKNLHLSTPPKIGPIKNILVYFGGTNQNKLIDLTLSAFLKLNRKDIILDVVDSNSPKKNKIKKLFKKNKNIKIHRDLASLAPLMLKADIAIGACGATSWERCCLGLPSIVITIANNQKPIAKELYKQGLIRWLGHYNAIAISSIYNALENSIDQNLETWSKACKLIVDGCGVEKVVSILSLSSKTKLKSRLANKKDEGLLLNWANDPLVRANSFDSSIILKKNHKKWLDFCLGNLKICKIFIVETKEGTPVGQVRFEKKNKKWYINYSLANFAREKKISTKLLKTAIYKFTKNQKVMLIAEVKKDNPSSCKAFEKIGFTKIIKNKYDFNVFKYQL